MRKKIFYDIILLLYLLCIKCMSGTIIVIVFAGREKYLKILFKYLDKLLQQKSIDVVHIWDYCRDELDRNYIHEFLSGNKEGYKFFTRVLDFTPYKEAYNHYLYYEQEIKDDDILIKSDDDIVYIDVKKFDQYVQRIKSDGLYFPNIINNDVMALIQHYNNVHNHVFTPNDVKHWNSREPLSMWFTKPAQAIAIHTLFLENPHKFSIELHDDISWRGRISVNFFGGRFSLIKRYFQAYVDLGKADDESFLSYDVYDIMKEYNESNRIVAFFNVAHFAFGAQERSLLETWILSVYERIAEEMYIPTTLDSIGSTPPGE